MLRKDYYPKQRNISINCSQLAFYFHTSNDGIRVAVVVFILFWKKDFGVLVDSSSLKKFALASRFSADAQHARVFWLLCYYLWMYSTVQYSLARMSSWCSLDSPVRETIHSQICTDNILIHFWINTPTADRVFKNIRASYFINQISCFIAVQNLLSVSGF